MSWNESDGIQSADCSRGMENSKLNNTYQWIKKKSKNMLKTIWFPIDPSPISFCSVFCNKKQIASDPEMCEHDDDAM